MWCGKDVLKLSVLASLMSHMRKCNSCVKNGQRTAGVISIALKNTQLPHTTSVERHYLDTVTYTCKSGYSLNELRYGKKEFFLGCKSDGTYDVPHLACQPINCTLDDAPTAKRIEFSGGYLRVIHQWCWVLMNG